MLEKCVMCYIFFAMSILFSFFVTQKDVSLVLACIQEPDK